MARRAPHVDFRICEGFQSRIGLSASLREFQTKRGRHFPTLRQTDSGCHYDANHQGLDILQSFQIAGCKMFGELPAAILDGRYQPGLATHKR
jgi:hypothetical protein